MSNSLNTLIHVAPAPEKVMARWKHNPNDWILCTRMTPSSHVPAVLPVQPPSFHCLFTMPISLFCHFSASLLKVNSLFSACSLMWSCFLFPSWNESNRREVPHFSKPADMTSLVSTYSYDRVSDHIAKTSIPFGHLHSFLITEAPAENFPSTE